MKLEKDSSEASVNQLVTQFLERERRAEGNMKFHQQTAADSHAMTKTKHNFTLWTLRLQRERGKAREKHIKFITRINIIGMCDFNISRTTPLYGCVLAAFGERETKIIQEKVFSRFYFCLLRRAWERINFTTPCTKRFRELSVPPQNETHVKQIAGSERFDCIIMKVAKWRTLDYF